MTDTITLPRSIVAGALHALDLSQALLESSKSIHHITVLEEYKSLRAALAQQAEQVHVHTNVKSSAGLIRNGKVDDFMESYFPAAPKEKK